jgi:hypothetical protein
MSRPPFSERLRAEADLLETFTRTYGRKFSELIERLNGPAEPATVRPGGGGGGGTSDLQCVRLCFEAVSMMLASQAQVARTLKEIAGPAAVPVAA